MTKMRENFIVAVWRQFLSFLGFGPPLPRAKGSKKANRRKRKDYPKTTKRALGSPAKGARVQSRRRRENK